MCETQLKLKHPINVGSKAFSQNKYAYYNWLLENAPVYKGKFLVLNAYFVSKYEDCAFLLKDPRVVRDRSKVAGKWGKLPLPLPRSVRLVSGSMILKDDPEHRRLRRLVHQAFAPRHIRKLGDRIETLTHELIDRAAADCKREGMIDLMPSFSLPIPVTVISEMMGIEKSDTDRFSVGLKALSEGMSGVNLVRTFLWDIPKVTKFMGELIERKRKNPGDDILTSLVEAEEDGEKLSDEELISMAYLLIIAGYETTVHLINNSVITLLQEPEQLRKLRDEPEYMESAIEEVLRYNGPIQSTKPGYATEELTIRGVTIPKGAMVLPLTGAANRDPDQFEDPNVFDITRESNRHLGFGHGIHYCLGAPLARLETKIALTNLLERCSNLRLAVPPAELTVHQSGGWHRYARVPIVLE